jgi:hypothetical protein
MLATLRTLPRDNDRTLWSDEELEDYLNRALDLWNITSPETELTRASLVSDYGAWKTVVFWMAIRLAVFALEVHSKGISEERLAKYRKLSENAGRQVDLAIPRKEQSLARLQGQEAG